MFRRKTECQRVRELLSPYIDERLSPSETATVEGHIERCSACRDELQALRATTELLHRVPMVPSPRSFALAAPAARRRPVAWGALRVATAMAMLVLAVVFVGDMLNVYQAPATRDATTEQKYTPAAEPAGGDAFLGTENGEATLQGFEAGDYAWPVRETEFAMVGVVVVLGGATVVVWLRSRRGMLPQHARDPGERRDDR
ncbi:MAG: zf-HC2 domain-containing protein [Chloroflexota bacterium]|nr:zf-HC2 domain-containing protein [Chloroflexota bacterium]